MCSIWCSFYLCESDIFFYDSLVLSTLHPLKSSEPSRTCYRLIGGTLVKRSVQDVVPTLETTHSGIKEVLDSLVKSYQEKEKEFDAWRKEAGVQVSISTSVYCIYKSSTINLGEC